MRQPPLTRGFTRRRFVALAGGAGLAALAGDAMFVEPNRLTTSHYPLRVPGAAETNRVSFVQLSDLHLHGVGAHEERIIHTVHALRPDFVVITGDVIDRYDRLAIFDQFLGLLDPALPRYAILGNWEHWASIDMPALHRVYAKHHVEFLINRSVLFQNAKAQVLITGLDDLVGGTPDIAAAMQGATPTAAHLVLAHCPAQRDLWSAPGFAPLAMISGHTHGGQIKIAGWAPYLPRGSGGYIEGRYAGAPFDLYVSRGVGMSFAPVRFGSAPEIVHFTIDV